MSMNPKLTAEVKLQDFEVRFYQYIKWQPKKGDYYTTTRSDLELYQVIDIDDEFIYTKYCDKERGDSVSKWEKEKFTTEGFGDRRMHVPNYLLNFKPITLTEEILLSFGFEKSSDGEHFFIGHFGFCLVYDGQDYCMKPLITDNMVIAYCRHLHQLQNLYLALTGKELEVKL